MTQTMNTHNNLREEKKRSGYPYRWQEIKYISDKSYQNI